MLRQKKGNDLNFNIIVYYKDENENKIIENLYNCTDIELIISNKYKPLKTLNNSFQVFQNHIELKYITNQSDVQGLYIITVKYKKDGFNYSCLIDEFELLNEDDETEIVNDDIELFGVVDVVNNDIYVKKTDLNNNLNSINDVLSGHTHNYISLSGGTITGDLNITGNIYQSGSTYETHSEQLYTTNDNIILRDGAATGLNSGEYAGFTAKKYDGVNDGQLVFDKDGWARVGDVGNLQKIATIEETTTNNYLMKYNTSTNRLEGVNPSTLPVTTASDLKYVAQNGGKRYHAIPVSTYITVSTIDNRIIKTGGAAFPFVGGKIIIGGIEYIVNNRIGNNELEIVGTFPNNMVGVSFTYVSLSQLDSSDGRSYFYTAGGGQWLQSTAGGGIGGVALETNGAYYSGSAINTKSDFIYSWSATSNQFNTKDLGIRRESAGLLTVFDGSNTSEYRDLKVKNVFADNIVFQDGAKYYHDTKWFTTQSGQTITISANGLTATLSNPINNYQFSSSMVGAKLIINGVGRIISGYTSPSVVTLSIPFLPSMFNQIYDYTLFGIYSKAYQSTDGTATNNYYNTSGVKTIFVDGNNNYNANCTYALFNYLEGNTVGIKNGYLGLALGTKIVATNQSGSGYQSTPDIGLIRGGVGLWTVFDGVTTNNLRDIKLRKLIAESSIKIGDDTDIASIDKVGSIRYRTSGNNSYCEMCMQTGTSNYSWIIIKQNSW